MKDLSTYFRTETVELMRSQIKLADYNPRVMTDESRKLLKKSVKAFGIVGGIVVNKRTGYTVVGGHQRIDILDREAKYPDNDYKIKVELVDLSPKEEKTLNAALNNQNSQGQFDPKKMQAFLADIDTDIAGFTPADLSLYGVDLNDFQSVGELDIANELATVTPKYTPASDGDEDEEDEIVDGGEDGLIEGRDEDDDDGYDPYEERDDMSRTEDVKNVKQQIMEKGQKQALDNIAYVVLSFDNSDNKAAFCQRFGYDPFEQYIKGEVFSQQIERIK